MKKILFLMAAISLTLTSCLKEDDSYKNLQSIYPGVNIYSAAMGQNNLSMVPVDEAFRLAILVAERVKQGKPADFDLSKLVNEKNVAIQAALFGNMTKVERDADSYTITFNPNVQMQSGYFLDGKITVTLNGSESLDEATSSDPWIVEARGLKIILKASSGTQQLTTEGGVVGLFAKDGGSYGVSVDGSVVKLDINSTSSRSSNWNGNFSIKSEGKGLAYSLWAGNNVKINGNASGATIYSFRSDGASTFLIYEVKDGIYRGNSSILSGEEQASVYGDVNPEEYPSKTVKIVWALGGGTIYYNGAVVNL